MKKKLIGYTVLCGILSSCNPTSAMLTTAKHPCEIPTIFQQQPTHFNLDAHGFPMDIDDEPTSYKKNQCTQLIYLTLTDKKNRPSQPMYNGEVFETVLGIYPDRETLLRHFIPRKTEEDIDPNRSLCQGLAITFDDKNNYYKICYQTGANIIFATLTENIALVAENLAENKNAIPFNKETNRPTENIFFLVKRDFDNHVSGIYFANEKVTSIYRTPTTRTNFHRYVCLKIIALNKGYALTYIGNDNQLKSFIISSESVKSGLIEFDEKTNRPRHTCYIDIEKDNEMYTIEFEK